MSKNVWTPLAKYGDADRAEALRAMVQQDGVSARVQVTDGEPRYEVQVDPLFRNFAVKVLAKFARRDAG